MEVEKVSEIRYSSSINEQSFKISDHILPHLLNSISKQDEAETIARLRNKAHRLLLYDANAYDAEIIFRLSKDVASRAYGNENIEVTQIIGEIGKCCIKQAKYKEAENMYFQKLKYSEDYLAVGHSDASKMVLDAHIGLITVYLNLNKLWDAEKHIKIAIAIAESQCKKNDQDIVEAYEMKGILHSMKGEYDNAIRIFRKVSGINI
jgi:tetratricopeptide (TPR) repeat protein